MAWYELGMLQLKSSPLDAKNSFQKAVTADPRYLPPYLQLAAVGATQGKWQEVADNVRKSLALDADGSAQIWYYDAVEKYNLGDKKGAEASGIKALSMDPNHTAPNTEQLVAVLEAGRGDYKDALAHLRNSLTYLPAGPNADIVKQQIAQIESVAR